MLDVINLLNVSPAPCDPTNVEVALQCLSGIVTVTWRAGAGANYYSVLAEANGHMDSCNSTGTSCELIHLQCGENYTVTVLAGDGKCNSSLLATTNVTTGESILSKDSLHANLARCQLQNAFADPRMFSLLSLSCSLVTLVTDIKHDPNDSSILPSQAPCAPVIQNHSLDCVSNHASVTWVKDEFAVGVTVNATSSLGDTASCSSSTNATCVLSGLACGHTYSIQTFAQGVQCLSKPSSAYTIVTGLPSIA